MLRLALAMLLQLTVPVHTTRSLRQPPLRVAHVEKLADGPMLVVDVPVVDVMMAEPEMAILQPNRGEHRNGLVSACEGEMEKLEMNHTHAISSRECEDQEIYTKRAVASLQEADDTDSLVSIENMFRKCAALSANCAKEVAQEVQLKMRLSGVTVESRCDESARDLQSKQSKKSPCQDKATKSMVEALAKEDLDGAIVAAQTGLRTCNNLPAPCDFQVAPILIVQLLQAKEHDEEQDITRALLSGLRQASDHSAKLATTRKLSLSTNAGSKGAAKMIIATEQKTISLIDIAERVHITSERRVVNL